MSENPYEAPAEAIPVVGIAGGRPEDVRKVAVYQKGILVCILINFCVYGALFAFRGNDASEAAVLAARAAWFATAIVGLAFVFLLSTKVYNLGVGIVFGILSVVPLVGLLVLLAVNGKATTILRANGHRVGLMGVRLSDV